MTSALGLEPGAFSFRPELEGVLVEAAAVCSEARLSFEVDRAPVMASPHAYQAKLEHEERRVILNGCFLDQFKGEAGPLSEFLKTHESVHWALIEDPTRTAWLDRARLDEESFADQVALYVLRRLH